jgi:hypothetical protein
MPCLPAGSWSSQDAQCPSPLLSLQLWPWAPGSQNSHTGPGQESQSVPGSLCWGGLWLVLVTDWSQGQLLSSLALWQARSVPVTILLTAWGLHAKLRTLSAQSVQWLCSGACLDCLLLGRSWSCGLGHWVRDVVRKVFQATGLPANFSCWNPGAWRGLGGESVCAREE